MKVSPGATDVTTYFKLVDPTTGVPETGLTITDLDMSYVRDGAAAVKADATALAAVDSAHGDNKMIQVDATNTPGLYRADWPDAAFAAGVSRVQLCINGAAIDPAYIEVELEAYAVNLTQILGTALTETAGGYLAAAFKKLFDVETPAMTAASVNQTGDSYGVVTHADYGNAQLVRSTTPANKLDVSATGEAGLDFSNIKAAAGPTTLTNITVPNVTLVGTTTTNTDMVAAAPSTADIVTAMQAAGTMLKALDDLTKAAGDGDLAAMKTIIDALPDAGALTTLQAAADAIQAVTDVIPDAGALTTLQAAVDALVAGAPINIDNKGIVITNEDITP